MANKIPSQICVEVAYAANAGGLLLSCTIPEGATVRHAIDASGILDQYPGIDLTLNKVGIFGKLTTLNTVLRAGERVEIYQPLLIDPKQARTLRAKRQK